MSIEQFHLSGYDDRKELLAQRYNRAGKSLFVIALPLHLIPSHLPIPDPAEPFEGNRKVNLPHATGFGDYWRANIKWATPPLLLDTVYPLSQEFTPHSSTAGVEFGVLKLPHNSGTELQILDGQHRILGWKVVSTKISLELKAAYEAAVRAKEMGDPISIQVTTKKIESLKQDQARLRTEYVTVEILEGVTPEDHKQYFHDIAVHAKGITKSLTTSFDRKDPINRISMDLATSHPLLREHVDFEIDTVRGAKNRNWISGKNLRDIVTVLAIGGGTNMTARKKDAINENYVTQICTKFFDCLGQEFKELESLSEGGMAPAQVREQSLLGSSTMLRALAAAYWSLAVDASDEKAPYVSATGEHRVRNLFGSLNGRMSLPIDLGWLSTGVFPDASSSAPGARSQELKMLSSILIEWANSGQSLPTSD